MSPVVRFPRSKRPAQLPHKVKTSERPTPTKKCYGDEDKGLSELCKEIKRMIKLRQHLQDEILRQLDEQRHFLKEQRHQQQEILKRIDVFYDPYGHEAICE